MDFSLWNTLIGLKKFLFFSLYVANKFCSFIQILRSNTISSLYKKEQKQVNEKRDDNLLRYKEKCKKINNGVREGQPDCAH